MKASFETKFSSMDSPLWNGHLPVPKKTALAFLNAGKKRILCSVNNQEAFPCALMPGGSSSYFILMNKAMARKLKLVLGSIVSVDIEADESEYGMPVPEEISELMKQDAIFENDFKKLTPGKQRNILYYIGKFKSADLRLSKSLIISEHLKANGGKLDHKQLYEALKKS